MLNNKKITTVPNLRFSGCALWDIVIFRLVAYLLNMICFILRILYKISYKYVLV